jgi:hypothetical protein
VGLERHDHEPDERHEKDGADQRHDD